MSQHTLAYLKGMIKEGDSLAFEALSWPVHCGDRGIQHHYAVYLNGNMLISDELFLLISENSMQDVVVEWLDSTLISYADAFALTGIIDSILALNGTLGYSVYGKEEKGVRILPNKVEQGQATMVYEAVPSTTTMRHEILKVIQKSRYTLHPVDLDIESFFEYADKATMPYQIEDIAGVIAKVPERYEDDSSVQWVVQLRNGKYAFTEAMHCDIPGHGFDCTATHESCIADTVEDAVMLGMANNSADLLAQADGRQKYETFL